MTEPYWRSDDDTVQLYLGDMRDVLPALGVTADLIVADPPYGETSLAWDRWPKGWPELARDTTSSMWCFGSMRMFLDRGHEFIASDWKLSQDVVWEKHNGSGFARDRFRRVHEIATHWYRGNWRDLHREMPRERGNPGKRTSGHGGTTTKREHTGKIGAGSYDDDGMRLLRSVQRVRSLNGRSLHPTEKPIGLLDPLIRYACPPGGLVLDPFAGSGSTLDAARQSLAVLPQPSAPAGQDQPHDRRAEPKALCDLMFENGEQCAQPAGHPDSDPHMPAATLRRHERYARWKAAVRKHGRTGGRAAIHGYMALADTEQQDLRVRAEAMERAMQSTATDALKHRGCHRDLMAQCLRAERVEAERDRLRAELAQARGAALTRAAAFREAADEIAGIDFHPNARARSLDIAAGLAIRLRRMAAGEPTS